MSTGVSTSSRSKDASPPTDSTKVTGRKERPRASVFTAKEFLMLLFISTLLVFSLIPSHKYTVREQNLAKLKEQHEQQSQHEPDIRRRARETDDDSNRVKVETPRESGEQSGGGKEHGHRGGQETAVQPRLRRDSPFFPAAELLPHWMSRDSTLDEVFNSMDSVFDDFLRHSFLLDPFPSLMGRPSPYQSSSTSLTSSPTWDVKEAEGMYHLRLSLPGVGKDEVSVSLTEDNTLLVHAEHKVEEKDVWKSQYRQNFQTSLALPDDISRNGIQAEMKNGVLNIIVPKQEGKAQQDMEVAIL